VKDIAILKLLIEKCGLKLESALFEKQDESIRLTQVKLVDGGTGHAEK